MSNIAAMLVKRLGYDKAMKMAEKFGLVGWEVREAAIISAARNLRRRGLPLKGPMTGSQFTPSRLQKRFPGKPTQSFAERKAARIYRLNQV